ncbi:MAG: hypothetical protein ABIG67_01850 [Pseudomonadota bacterium]
MAVGGLLFILAVAALYPLTLRLASQIHAYRAKNHLLKGHYGLASINLEKAHACQPADYSILNELGEVYHRLGELVPRPKEAWSYALKAKEITLKAVRLNPLDAESAYGLARAEARLEQLYSHLHPGERTNPHQPLPYYEQALRLRPNGIFYHYALALYLYQHDRQEDLLRIVRNLARVYPPVYPYLKKEKFWSPTVRDAVKQGLEQAVVEGISPRDAHKALSSLFAGDKALPEAITHYEKALLFRAFENSAGDFIHLGRLHLKNGAIEEAEDFFIKGLARSRARERDLEGLYHVYKNEGLLERLQAFYDRVRNQFRLSGRMDLLTARSLIELKQYNQARRILM